MPGSLPPLQLVGDPVVQQNFDAIALRWPAEDTYAGSGSPNSAVTGSPGASYVDRANGIRWVHASSSSGSTGWLAQTVAATPLRTLTGGFTGATAATLFAGTGGWSVVRNALGNYTVTFTTAFSSANVVPAITIYQSALWADVTVCNATTLTVLTFNGAGALAEATGVLFVVQGSI